MVEVIERATSRALSHYGDSCTEEFYTRLKKKELCTTRCTSCGSTVFPPRPFCPSCFSHQVEWVSVPPYGRLYAFTQQHRAFRFNRPEVIGLVDLCDGELRLLTRIDAPLEALEIGMVMELSFIELSSEIVLHQFRPAQRP